MEINFCVLFLQNELTALMLASENGHTQTVKYLVDAKAQLDLQKRASIDHITRNKVTLKHTSILILYIFYC